MTQATVRTLVAFIVLFGHIAVFGSAMLLGVFGPLTGVDVVQTVMMATPVLGVTATAALTYALATETGTAEGKRVTALFAACAIVFPTMLLVGIFLIFYFVYIQVPNFGPSSMKISLGGLETVFGTYLGAIATRLFGSSASG